MLYTIIQDMPTAPSCVIQSMSAITGLSTSVVHKEVCSWFSNPPDLVEVGPLDAIRTLVLKKFGYVCVHTGNELVWKEGRWRTLLSFEEFLKQHKTGIYLVSVNEHVIAVCTLLISDCMYGLKPFKRKTLPYLVSSWTEYKKIN